jgi:hypothetical protein
MLDRQLVPVRFTSGLDTKSDPKAVQGKLLALQNGVFTKSGEILKRFGYTALSQNIVGGGTISTGMGLASFGKELVSFDGSSLYSFSPGLSSWANKGTLASINVTSKAIARNSYSQSAADSAVINNLLLVAYESSNYNGVRYSIVDLSTGNFIKEDLSLASGFAQPKVLVLGTSWIVVYAAGTSVSYSAIDSTTLALSGGTLGLTYDASHPHLDACVSGGKLYVVWTDTAGPGFTLVSISTPGGTVTTNAVAESAAGNVCVFGDTFNGKIAVGYYDGSNVKVHTFNPSSLASLAAATTVESIAGVTQLTGTADNNTKGLLFYTVGATQSYNRYVRKASTSNYSAFTLSTLARSVGLIAKPFPYLSKTYVPLHYSSSRQSTFFLSDDSGNMVGKMFPGQAGAIPARTALAESARVANGKYTFTLPVVDLLTTQPGTTSVSAGSSTPLFTLQGLHSITLNFLDGQNSYNSATLGNNLHVGGGFLYMYDGCLSVEHNFHLYPENIVSQVAPFGGCLGVPSGASTAAWDVSAVYEWTDNQGQIHRSSPSVPNRAAFGGTGSEIPTFGYVDNGNGITIGGIAAANVATSYSAAASFNITASTTNGSSTVTWSGSTVVPGFVYANQIGDYLLPGSAVSGAGIPSGATISSVGSGSFTLSTLATATNANVTLTISPAYSFLGQISGNSITLQEVDRIWFSGIATSGSTTIPVFDTTGLQVGMTVYSAGSHILPSTTITAIGTNSITLSAGAYDSVSGYVLFWAQAAFSGTATSGSPNLTGCSADAVAYAAANVGRQIQDGLTHIPAGAVILSASGTTITLSANAAANGTSSFVIYSTGDKNLRVGNVVTGPVIYQVPINTQILSLSSATANLTSSATFNSGVGVTFKVTNLAGIIHTIPTLRLTAKQTFSNPVEVVTYRTQGNGSVLYRASSVASPTLNSTTADTVTFYDLVQDINLISAPSVYTTGSVLENISPGPVSCLTVHKNRVFALDTTDPLKIWFSKQVVPGSPVEFSDFLTENADPSGGDVTGIASMDDKLIVFKKTSIFYLTGTGPNSIGNDNDFNLAQLPTDSGCSNPRSICLTPMGLMYQSLKGIMLLGRSLQVSYIGADVEGYNNLTVTSAKLIENVNQVRFTLSSGLALVYDYLANQWSQFTNHSAVDATAYLDQYAYIQSGGKVMVETANLFTDDGAFIPLSLTTSWIQFAGLQGYQRVRRAMFIGDWSSPHNLLIDVAYDFDNTVAQSLNIAEPTAPTGTAIGFPFSFPINSGVGPYQVLVHLANQKCEAISISLSESQNSPYGEGLRLSGLTFEIGVKKGLRRVSAANSVG